MHHIHKTLRFEAWHVPYINWQALAEERAQLACELHVVPDQHGNGLTVTLSWADADPEGKEE